MIGVARNGEDLRGTREREERETNLVGVVAAFLLIV